MSIRMCNLINMSIQQWIGVSQTIIGLPAGSLFSNVTITGTSSPPWGKTSSAEMIELYVSGVISWISAFSASGS